MNIPIHLPIAERADTEGSSGTHHADDGGGYPQGDAEHEVEDAESEVAVCGERRVVFLHALQERFLQ